MTAPDETPAKMPSSAARRRVMTIESRFDDEQLAVEPRQVEDRRDEAVVEAAQPADRIALERLAGDDLISGRCSFSRCDDPMRVPPVPSPATKTSSSGQSRTISSAVPS